LNKVEFMGLKFGDDHRRKAARPPHLNPPPPGGHQRVRGGTDMALPVVRSSQPTTGWDPFRELNELHTQLHRWMDSVLERTSGLTADPLSWSPLADLSETEDAYLVEVEVPGVSREDISIDLSGTELVITGERKEREREGWFRHRTRSVGRFHYAVTLPRDIDPDGVDATLSQGVLTVRIPKSKALKPRRIAITER